MLGRRPDRVGLRSQPPAIALVWLHRQPVVTAPLVGAGSIAQIDDAVASLDVRLADEDVRALIVP